MPPLEVMEPIRSPLAGSVNAIHPGPSQMPLRLERMSVREQLWQGRRFGIDTPYYAVPLGWGEWAPAVVPGDSEFVVVIDPRASRP